MALPDATRLRGLSPWSRAALLLLASFTGFDAQQVPTIRVPARLVSVPTLVLGQDNRVLVNLQVGDFRLFDDERPQEFQVDSSTTPLSVVVAVQANLDVREYLPFLSRVGSALDALLVGDGGESAALIYGDEVTLTKSFGAGDLGGTFRQLSPRGFHARATDAAVRALAMLRQRPATRTRVLLLIGQPADHGSEYSLEDLRRDALLDNVMVHALALPEIGKSFVSDTFSLRGLSSSNILERGGFKAGADLTRLIPALSRTAASAEKSDPFGTLTAITGGTLLHFRKQTQLEDAIAIVGLELRSLHTLSYKPSGEPGYHALRVECTVSGTKTHARPGYWLTGN